MRAAAGRRGLIDCIVSFGRLVGDGGHKLAQLSRSGRLVGLGSSPTVGEPIPAS
jgi:hypothetical protein